MIIIYLLLFDSLIHAKLCQYEKSSQIKTIMISLYNNTVSDKFKAIGSCKKFESKYLPIYPGNKNPLTQVKYQVIGLTDMYKDMSINKLSKATRVSMIFYALATEDTEIYFNFKTNNTVIIYLNDNKISYSVPLQLQKQIDLCKQNISASYMRSRHHHYHHSHGLRSHSFMKSLMKNIKSKRKKHKNKHKIPKVDKKKTPKIDKKKTLKIDKKKTPKIDKKKTLKVEKKKTPKVEKKKKDIQSSHPEVKHKGTSMLNKIATGSMVVSSLSSVGHLGLLYSMSKHHAKSNSNNIPDKHSGRVINLVHNIKPICNTESVYHSVKFNLIKGWNKISISATTSMQLIYIKDIEYNQHVSYAPFIPYAPTKPSNCPLEHISKFNGKYLYLNITKYTYGGHSARTRLKACFNRLDLDTKLFELTFNKTNSLIKMKLEGKLNKQEIKSILHTCTSNYCGFYQKLINL